MGILFAFEKAFWGMKIREVITGVGFLLPGEPAIIGFPTFGRRRGTATAPW